MRPVFLVAVLVPAMSLAAALPAAAQQAQLPNLKPLPVQVTPYKPVTVSAPQPLADPSFQAFRSKVGDVAKRKDRAALSGLVVAKGFFWQREDGKPADPKKSSVDTLVQALGLSAPDGSGWQMLGAFAAEPTAEPVPEMKGIVCAPASPTFADKDFQQLIESTKSDPSEWVYPATPGLEVHAKNDAGSPVVEKLGLILVRGLPDEQGGAGDWARVATPSGKTGFVPASAVVPLVNEQLCYSKDAGGWHIAGYAGGGEGE